MMFDDETIVLISGYMSKDAANQDYEAVLGSAGSLHGAVAVSKDPGDRPGNGTDC